MITHQTITYNTTDDSTQTISLIIENASRISGNVMMSNTTYDKVSSFSFVAVCRSAEGTTTLDYSNVVIDFESDAGTNIEIVVTENVLYISFTGLSGATANWLFDITLIEL